jgi:hypothetical protein
LGIIRGPPALPEFLLQSPDEKADGQTEGGISPMLHSSQGSRTGTTQVPQLPMWCFPFGQSNVVNFKEFLFILILELAMGKWRHLSQVIKANLTSNMSQ